MNAAQSKADMVRERLDEIAYHRMEGQTWPTIATFLSVMGLSVTGDEIRSYWGRFAAGKHPAEFLVERYAARAKAAECQLSDAEGQVQKLEGALAAWTAMGARIAAAYRAQNNEDILREVRSISEWYDRAHPGQQV